MSGEHPNRAEDFDLYALGALDGAERKAFESHLASCADCAEKLATARGRMAILAFAAPPTEPSPGVKESLMRQVIASAQGPGGSLARVQPEPSDAWSVRAMVGSVVAGGGCFRACHCAAVAAQRATRTPAR